MLCSSFFHKNMFDSLRGMPEEEYDDYGDIEDEITESAENPASSSVPSPRDETQPMSKAMDDLRLEGKTSRQHCMLQPWDSDFWRTYGNKLRVYGTEEEVCDLVQIQTGNFQAKEEVEPSPTRSILQRFSDFLMS